MGEFSLKRAAVILGSAPGVEWSLKKAVKENPSWPSFGWPEGTVSARDLAERYSAAGEALAAFRRVDANMWKHVNRSQVGEELRRRVIDPALIRQDATSLCGPASILFELARRRPSRYVEWADDLLRLGWFKSSTGEAIKADEEMRAHPVPSATLAHVDWILAATMREHENLWEDVDDGGPVEGMTLPGAMRVWTPQILGLGAKSFDCWTSDEVPALRSGLDAIKQGGVAFVLIGVDLIQDGSDETEENAWWIRRHHVAGVQPAAWGDSWTHSEDDDVLPDHWVALLDVVESGDRIRLRLWSWGSEYRVEATLDSIGEYVYEVVVGTP